MSDQEAITTDAPRENRGSPIPGCLILGTILVVFGGLVILYTCVGYYQNRTIGTFTQDKAALIAVDTPSPARVDAAMAKLKQIESAVAAGRAERVLFTVEDLNVLIAALPVAEGFRGNTRVEEITSEGLVAVMAQPLRKGVFKKGFRYLNATFVLQPELRARTIAFKVMSIRPTIGEVPEPFVKSYSVLDLFRLDPENPAIKAHASRLGAVYTEAGQLVVETKVGPGA